VAHWTVDQLITLVLRWHPNAGGSMVIPAVSIAYAESGGDDHAISRSGDYGLWQINRIHFGDGIINQGNWTSSSVQVAEMWRLSNGMDNWAAWCTAWRDPGPNCGHGYLNYPQIGSPARSEVPAVTDAWNRRHGTPPPGQAPNALSPEQQDERDVSAAFSYLRNYYGRVAHTQLAQVASVTRSIARER
jgi:Transglycosylase SLT domain